MWNPVQGKIPNSIQSRRACGAGGVFIFKTVTVAEPVGVRPTISPVCRLISGLCGQCGIGAECGSHQLTLDQVFQFRKR